jgi:DNA-binding CsgD family transcriptional regulator
MPESVDWIGIIEAVYAIEQPRERWLQGVIRAAAPLTTTANVGGILYDISQASAPRLDFITALDVPPGWVEMAIAGHTTPTFAPAVVANARKYMCASSRVYLRDYGAHEQEARARMQSVGLHEAVLINGLDASGRGCALYLLSKTSFELPTPLLGFLKRLAAHLATAYRLQRRVAELNDGGSAAEAVLDEDGRLLHAEGDARANDCRSSLSFAAQQLRWARGKARHEQPAPAVDAWKGLVASRWSLHERRDSDGRSFIYALPNPPASAGPNTLSLREQQVATLATLGRSNKLIAYELGLAAATVRVLMARAARSRAELIARLEALSTTDPPRSR